MGQITSGIGLVSGIDIASLVDQIMSLEARPKNLVVQQNAVLSAQQVAFQEISAKLLVLKLTASRIASTGTFDATNASSTNEAILTATSSSATVPGTYSFIVDRLVSTQQLISSGFQDRDITPVGAGTLSFEFGDGRLDSDTELARLNGGLGITRGDIRVTDRSGASAVVDLSRALTANDVLDAINNTGGVDVTASIDGDHFVLTDNTGLGVQNLSVADVGGTGTATALGLTGSIAGATLTGSDVNTVGRDTRLTMLNDGNGVRMLSAQSDLEVTRQDGTSFEVALGGSATLGDVIDKINAASGGTVVRCHKCNAENDTDAKFCDGCGAALTKTRACPACSELNDPDARFCDNCGHRFE